MALFKTRAAADVPNREPEPVEPQAKADDTVQVTSIRETINLLESDLAAMIGEVQRASDLVCREAEDSAAATRTIAENTDGLVGQAGTASKDVSQLAQAIEELARAADEIGSQVRKADELTDAGIDRHVRSWEKPSDHVPVWIDLAVGAAKAAA